MAAARHALPEPGNNCRIYPELTMTMKRSPRPVDEARGTCMRIERAGGTGAVSAGNTVRRSGGDGFSVSEQEASQRPTANTGVRSIGGIEVLMALQGVEEPGERRRRAIARGRSALDVLDELKIALLAGDLDAGTAPRLKAAASGLKDVTGDPALDAVLAEIDLRVEVELAKMAAAPML
jgi:hypothetical protein